MIIVSYIIDDWGNNGVKRGVTGVWDEVVVRVLPPSPAEIARLDGLWIVPGTIDPEEDEQ